MNKIATRNKLLLSVIKCCTTGSEHYKFNPRLTKYYCYPNLVLQSQKLPRNYQLHEINLIKPFTTRALIDEETPLINPMASKFTSICCNIRGGTAIKSTIQKIKSIN